MRPMEAHAKGHGNCVVSHPAGRFGVGNRQDLRVYCHDHKVVILELDYCVAITAKGSRCQKVARPDLGDPYCPLHRPRKEADSGPA